MYMLLQWALVVLGIALLLRWLVGNHFEANGHRHALEILEQRYAKGEITRAQFERMKSDLAQAAGR